MAKPSGRKIYEFGEFRLDAGHRMLYRGDDEIPLAPKAIETLIALIEHRGEIIGKDELLDIVWPNAIVEESNLFLYLSVLRKTLGTQKDGQPWVETLRRRGYRFNGDVRVMAAEGNGALFPPRSPRLAAAGPTDPNNDSPIRPPDTVSDPPRRVRSVYAAVGIIALLLAMTFGYKYFVANRPVRSIAVLPFASDSGDADGELVSEGMTINLIGSLSKIPGLEVKASSTMDRYKGSSLDAATIGKELNVETVLASRMVQRGDDLTMYVELVDSKTENSLWQRTYQTKSSYLGVLSREVMADVVSALSVHVTDSTRQRLAKDYSESAEATRLYLKGLVLIRKLTEPKIREGLVYLRQATEHDPYFAPAFAMIASAHRALTLCCDVHPSELDEARTAALRAVEIDDNSAEAHSSLASTLFFRDWNFAEAEKHFLRALELDPNSAITHFQYADFLGRMGKRDEANAERHRALELEPYSPFFNAFTLLDSEQSEALENIRFTIELDPNFYFSHFMAAGVYRRMKMYPEALAEFRRAKELAPEQTWTDISHIGVLNEIGEVDQARAIQDELLRRSESRFVPPYHIAIVYNQRGDTEQALDWLEKAYQVRDPKMTFLKTGPGWKKLNGDPRFQDLYHRVGF
jgi:DNA-binding winged helix-turn-helix (wHTH) protein/TolB-like protein